MCSWECPLRRAGSAPPAPPQQRLSALRKHPPPQGGLLHLVQPAGLSRGGARGLGRPPSRGQPRCLAAGRHLQGSSALVPQPVSLRPQPGPLDACILGLAGPGPVWAGTTALPSGCGSGGGVGAVWVQPCRDQGWASCLLPGLSLRPYQVRHFSPLISGPSTHCLQSSDGETEAKDGNSRVESGQGAWGRGLRLRPHLGDSTPGPSCHSLCFPVHEASCPGGGQARLAPGRGASHGVWCPLKPGAGLWREELRALASRRGSKSE